MIPARYVFFGTPEFAAIVLKQLIRNGLIPDAVVCNPDRPVGRKKILTPPPTKVLAEKYNVPVLQPEVLDFRSQILDSDFFIIAAYAKILPKEILEIPRLGTIGVHPSLLPAYRGSSPIQSTILAGEKETGVTLYLVDEKMDHGPIIASIKCHIDPKDSYGTLMPKLAELGGQLLADRLPDFVQEKIKPELQNEKEATFTKKFERKDAFVEPEDFEKAVVGSDSLKAQEIERKIRAFNPEPGAWTIKNGKQIKLLEAEISGGKLILKKTQIEGEKPKAI